VGVKDKDRDFEACTLGKDGASCAETMLKLKGILHASFSLHSYPVMVTTKNLTELCIKSDIDTAFHYKLYLWLKESMKYSEL